jgi:hypothetical protein
MDGYVYYDFKRKEQTQPQPQTQPSYAQQSAEVDWELAIGIGLVIGGVVIIVATIVEDFFSAGAGVIDDPATIGFGCFC